MREQYVQSFIIPEPFSHLSVCLSVRLCVCVWLRSGRATSAATAWEFTQDLGNLGINLGFRKFSKQSWEFWYIREISWNTCNSKLTTTNIGCVHSLSHCLSLCYVSAITAFTYLSRSFLKHCSSHSSAVKTSSETDPVTPQRYFSFFICLEILRSTWEFWHTILGIPEK